MAKKKKRALVALGMIGSRLDAGKKLKRWEKWRPTVALCQQPDLAIDRLELLHQTQHGELAEFVAADIGEIAPDTEVRLHSVQIEDPWDLEETYAALEDFARSYPFAPEREDYLVHIATGTHVVQICWFLLTEAHFVPGRLVQTSPGSGEDRAVGWHRVFDLDLSKYDSLARRFERDTSDARAFLKAGIATQDAGFNALIDRIEQVAVASKEPILLTGPTGAGKSELARRIYELKKSRRQLEGAFVPVNCATLRGDGAMGALFGHTKGAFTGAASAREGLLRAADGGLLFLDEIGELGLEEQAMLLRAVERGRFLPLGADKERQSDFSLIAGTNHDLRARVAEGAFREDLLARIDLWYFELPGLARRRSDVAPNLTYELDRASQRTGRRISFNKEARTRFLRFAEDASTPWLGNFRDLNAAVLRMATLSYGGRIDVATVDEEIARLRRSWRRPGRPGGTGARVPAALGEEEAAALDRFDRVQLEDVLAVCADARSLSDAGRALFSESRKKKKSSNDADRLRKYLARFGLSWSELG